MRHLITSMTDTIATILGKRSIGNEVTNPTPRWLFALAFARCLPRWLTGIAPVGSQVVNVRHLQPAVVLGGAAAVRRHYGLSTLRPRGRRMEPRSGASLDRS